MAAPRTARISTLGIIVLLVIAVFKYGPAIKRSAEGERTLPSTTGTTSKQPSNGTSKNSWTVYQNCPLVDHQNNDGDNYQIRQPDGRIDEFRLYFVDTPESSLTRSSDGNTNGELIAQQAEYFGGNSSDESIRLGAEAKELTLSLLKANPFMIFTRHEKVDESGRFYCHLRVDIDGQSRWLDEVLIEKGYARIISQPADLPDGSKAENHRTLLQQLESSAKHRKAGGWK